MTPVIRTPQAVRRLRMNGWFGSLKAQRGA